MSGFQLVFIKKSYFSNHPNLKEILKSEKRDESNRIYLYPTVLYKNNNIFIPLRKEMEPITRFGIIGFSVPSNKRPTAGLDYRKILIINNLDYIEFPPYARIPNIQEKLIRKNLNTIQAQVVGYIKGYERSFNKNRTLRDKKFRFSSLCNFHRELGLE